jgi:hypothetical protein
LHFEVKEPADRMGLHCGCGASPANGDLGRILSCQLPRSSSEQCSVSFFSLQLSITFMQQTVLPGKKMFERSKTPVPVLHGGLGLPQKCHHLQSSGRSRPRSALAAVRNLDNRSVASLQSVQSCSSCVSFQRPRLGLSGEHAVSQSTAVLGPAHIAGHI